jgi:hypothetical protein
MRIKNLNYVLLFFCATSVCCVNFEDISSDAKAVFEVCEEFFIKKSIEFDIIGYGRFNDKKILDMINEVGMKIGGRSPSKIILIDTQQFDRLSLSRPALIITSNDSLNMLHASVDLDNFHGRPIKFLTYAYGEIFNILSDQYLTYSFGKIHHYEYFILQRKGEIALSTLEWFSPEYCNEAHLKKISIFDKKSQKWLKPLVYEKFQNFHQCNLILGVYSHTINYYPDRFTNKKLGTVVDTFFGASQVANFTPQIHQFNTDDDFEKYKLSVFFMTMAKRDFLNYNWMPAYFQHISHIVVSTSAPYSIYEKLFLPFDKTTWAFLIITFAIAFSVIFVVNFMPQWVKDMIYGERVRTPTMNIFYVFFGFGQVRVPRQSFARFLLLNLLFLCLIFRTCYQSKLFEFMTSDMRRPQPVDIEDMLEINYTFYSQEDIGFTTLKIIIGKDPL